MHEASYLCSVVVTCNDLFSVLEASNVLGSVHKDLVCYFINEASNDFDSVDEAFND